MSPDFKSVRNIGTELNILLDLVYNLADSSDGVSGDLESIIGELVRHVEDMVDKNDEMMEAWK